MRSFIFVCFSIMHSGPHPHCHKCQDIILFLKYGFIYFGCAGWWLWCTGFLQLWKGGYSLRVGYGLWGTQAAGVMVQGPQSTGPVVVAHRPTCPAARGIFPDQGSNLCAFAGEFFYPLNHQGSPILLFFLAEYYSSVCVHRSIHPSVHRFRVSPAVREISLLSTSLPTPLCCLFDNSHSDRCKVISHCGFNLHFPNN